MAERVQMSRPREMKHPKTGKLWHHAYHIHNFVSSIETLRFKYRTYGHPVGLALKMPLAEIHPSDLGYMVRCVLNRKQNQSSSVKKFQTFEGGWQALDRLSVPLAFHTAYAKARDDEVVRMLLEDENGDKNKIINVEK